MSDSPIAELLARLAQPGYDRPTSDTERMRDRVRKRFRRLACRGGGSTLLGGAALLGILLAAAGCGGDSGPQTESKATPAKIAFLEYTIADYQQAMVVGMKKKVGPGGGGVTVFNANFDPQKQQQQCQDAVQSGRYNVLVLAPVSGPAAVPCVTRAKAANIPVIAIENAIGTDGGEIEPQVEGVVKSILTPPESNAQGLADLTKLACEDLDPCEVIAEIATPTDALTIRIVDQIAATVPNAEVVQKIATGYDPSALQKALPDALSAHPGTDVFVSIADFEALAAIPVLKSAGKLKAVKVIGNGGSRTGIPAVKDGRIFATLGTWPRQMGELAGTAAVEAVNGEEISGPAGVDAFYIDEPLLVTKDNVEQFTPEW